MRTGIDRHMTLFNKLWLTYFPCLRLIQSPAYFLAANQYPLPLSITLPSMAFSVRKLLS